MTQNTETSKTNQIKPLLVLIGGPSASGKTSLSRILQNGVEDQISEDLEYSLTARVMNLDDFYKNQSEKSMPEKVKTNYDHPKAFEWELAIQQVKELIDRRTIKKPNYSFTEHTRLPETESVDPADIIIFEGIFALLNPEINQMAGLRLYVDTRLTECLMRRAERDVRERGRTLDSVFKQWRKFVEPGYWKYILPTKEDSDFRFDWNLKEQTERAERGTLAIIEKYFRTELQRIESASYNSISHLNENAEPEEINQILMSTVHNP